MMQLGAVPTTGLSSNSLVAKAAMAKVCKHGRIEPAAEGAQSAASDMIADPAGSLFLQRCLAAAGLTMPRAAVGDPPVAAKALAAVLAALLHHCNRSDLMSSPAKEGGFSAVASFPSQSAAAEAAISPMAVAALQYANDHVLRFDDISRDGAIAGGLQALAETATRGSSAQVAEVSLDRTGSSPFISQWLQDLLAIRPAAGSATTTASSGEPELESGLSGSNLA